jgi:hypothetical protein
MESLISPYIIPLGAFVMVVLLMALESMKGVREEELEAYRELRIREMDHLRRMKELEVERAHAASHTCH